MDLPIFSNFNWTDIFTIVDPNKIEINHLNLASSFEIFIICITKISKVLSNPNDFEKKMITYFDNRIYGDYMQGKISKEI
jgi:hypothetical protein